MRKLIMEYRESLRALKNAKVAPIYQSIMITDTEWAIRYMETGRIPPAKWSVSRWSKVDREILFDPQIIEKSFKMPPTTSEASEGLRLILEHLMGRLSPREREAFVLTRGQGLTFEKAADFMGISKSSISTLIKRADDKFIGFKDLIKRKKPISEIVDDLNQNGGKIDLSLGAKRGKKPGKTPIVKTGQNLH